jgi:hypothetical protein
MRIFGEKPISRMNGVRTGDFGRAQDIGDIPIAQHAVGGPHAYPFISRTGVQAMDIGFRMNGDGFNPEFLTGSDDPEGDFTPICNQYFFKHSRPRE